MGRTALFPFRQESCNRFLSPLKISRSRPGLNPRILGPMASTLLLDHRGRQQLILLGIHLILIEHNRSHGPSPQNKKCKPSSPLTYKLNSQVTTVYSGFDYLRNKDLVTQHNFLATQTIFYSSRMDRWAVWLSKQSTEFIADLMSEDFWRW
jgi:hypothetical protein